MTTRIKTYGPWVVVTGASDGIGRAFAMQLAKSGLNVILSARRARVLEELAVDIERMHHVETLVVAGDLGAREGIEGLIEATKDLDVGMFVAAAGFGTSGDFVSAELASELSMIDVNCRAVVELSHHYARRFVARGSGGIVLFGSIVGWQGTPHAANYAATKAFVQTFAEGLGHELSGTGVEVVSSAPGPVRSGFADRADMTMGFAHTPEVVASQTLAILGRRRTAVPGWFSKLLTWSLTPLPRFLRVRIMAQVMGGMANGHGSHASPVGAE